MPQLKLTSAPDHECVDALLVVFCADGSVDYKVPVRVPALSEADRELQFEACGKLRREGPEA